MRLGQISCLRLGVLSVADAKMAAAPIGTTSSLSRRTGGKGAGVGVGICPACRLPYDIGKKRCLMDACGHERCYTCMFTGDECPLCSESSTGMNAYWPCSSRFFNADRF